MNPTENENQDLQSPNSNTRPVRASGYDMPIRRRPPLSRSYESRRPAELHEIPAVSKRESFNNEQNVSINDSLATPPSEVNDPEPVIQMPQPSTFTPPDVSPRRPADFLENSQPSSHPSNTSHNRAFQHLPEVPTDRRHDFSAPASARARNKFLYPALTLIVIIFVVVAFFGYGKVMAIRNKPDTVMKNAINNSLSLSSVDMTTKTQNSTIQTSFDFDPSDGKPTINTKMLAQTPKTRVGISGYGDLKNTYVSYDELPKSINDAVLARAEKSWVQVRDKGDLPKNIPDIMFRASDPRYQLIGPVIIGSYKGQTRDQLRDFILKNKVYNYDKSSVTKSKLGDDTVFVFPIKLNISYLKVSAQSAAVNIGLEPSETQLAIDTLDNLSGAETKLYIRAKDHKIMRFESKTDNKKLVVDLDNYNIDKDLTTPQTKLSWQSFMPLQNQIEVKTLLTKAQY